VTTSQITEHVIAAAFGTVLVLSVLISALETVVLPRNGFTRIARFVFAVVDRLLLRKWRNRARRDNLRALYGPVALVSLPLVWMLLVTVGFSFIFWGISSNETRQHAFEISGSSLFTLGFAEPAGTARIWLTFVEATIGLGLVALLIGYLPTIYAAHHQREKGISVLRPFAGTPPAPVPLLANLFRLGALQNPDLWRTAADWMLDLDQTHSAFPALCYFPESSSEQSWVASVGSMLDAAALLLSTSGISTQGHASDETKGPMMALAYGSPILVRIAQSAGLPVETPSVLLSLVAQAASSETVPPIAISREEYVHALDQLQPLVAVPENDRESCWREFAWIRSGYDLALRGLAGLTLAPEAPWTTDRAADVGRPRLFTQRPLHVTW
jgi:hypothetical protein